MSDIPTLTITLSTNVVNYTGFSLTVDGSPVALVEPTEGAGTITFKTGYIYQDQTVLLSYTPGDVVDAVTGTPMAAFLDLAVTNNSQVQDPNPTPPPDVPEVTASSTISLTSTDDPATYDGFRVYIDSETTPRYDGPGGTIMFGDLSPQVALGLHTLTVKTYNALGESIATPASQFLMT